MNMHVKADSELRAGDRVRVTHTDFDTIPIGTITTIARIDRNGDAWLAERDGDDDGFFFYAWEFIPAPHFAVGDKVRFTKDNPIGGAKFGKKGDVITVAAEVSDSGYSYGPQIGFKKDRGSYWIYHAPISAIEPAPTYSSCAAAEVDNLRDEYGSPKARFKVGDRVRFKQSYSLARMRGKEATVICINPWGSVQIHTAGDVSTEEPSSLEHVAPATATATLRIAAGKFYKTRDCRKVGPMTSARGQYDDQYPFTVDHEFDSVCGTAWRSDGTFDPCHEAHIADLIAEWPVVAEATAEPDSRLLVTISADTSALDAEIDRVTRRLKKIAKRARKLGINLEYSDLRDAA